MKGKHWVFKVYIFLNRSKKTQYGITSALDCLSGILYLIKSHEVFMNILSSHFTMLIPDHYKRLISDPAKWNYNIQHKKKTLFKEFKEVHTYAHECKGIVNSKNLYDPVTSSLPNRSRIISGLLSSYCTL